MKIKPEHLEHMKAAIDSLLPADSDIMKNMIAAYESGDFPRSEAVKDLQKRFCFDVLYCANLTTWVCDNLYSYLDDTHIYSALKSLLPTLTKRY